MPKIEFRKAIIPDEIETLCEFDRKAFHDRPSDIFSPEEWKKYESYWMIVDGTIVGCAALQTDEKEMNYGLQTLPSRLNPKGRNLAIS